MPKPRPGESKDAFVNRCIPIVIRDGTAKDQSQAVAVCHSLYKQHSGNRGEDMPGNILAFIYESAWAITEQSLETIISIASRENLDFDVSTMQKNVGIFRTEGSPLSTAPRVWMRGDTAVIPVIGPIFPRANLFTQVSGATSIQSLTADFRAALESEEVSSIILYVDSPGGQVTGVQEFASLVYESRAIKPVKGYIYGQGASAAYNIVSATSEIISADMAIAGSIGVLSAVKDNREQEKKSGVRTVEFVSSVSPNKTINFDDKESLGKVQRMVDALGKVMVENIARFRGITSENVLEQYGQGDVFVGQVALEHGLIDRIGTFEALVKEMNTSSSITLMKGEGSMDLETLKSQHPETYAAAVAIGKKEAEASFSTKLEAAKVEGATAERERIKNIETIKVPGAAAVIAEMKFEPTATKESVAVAILEKQQETAAKQQGNIADDAQALADQTGQVATGQEEGTDTAADAEAKAAEAAMVDGINSK